MNERIRVAPLEDLPDGRGVRVDADDVRIAMFRVGNDVYAIGDRCSHAEASLAEGELFELDVECPRHGSEFDIRTGIPDSLPATRPVPTYVVEVDDGVVYVVAEPGDAS